MCNYFFLDCRVGAGGRRAELKPSFSFAESWTLGERFDTPPPSPIQLTWENQNGKKMSWYRANSPPLMRRDLVECLRAAGVDNLDTYEVVIHSTKGKQSDNLDYVAVNVIGAYAVADREKSEVWDNNWGNGKYTVSFETIVIDEHRAAGRRMFRMLESISEVIIHATVKEALEAAGGFGLTFWKPEDYVT